MAKIKITSKSELYDGMSITFKAPCKCTAVDGLKVYYNGSVQSFILRDAHGNNLANLNNLFYEGAYIKAILDTGNGYAYLQNADSNAYLEQKLGDILKDETKALYGLASSAVPNDLFAHLGRYAQHWWRRTEFTPAQSKMTPFKNQFIRMSYSAGSSVPVYYSDTVFVSKDGSISMTGSLRNISYNNAYIFNETVRGKYFRVYLNGNYTAQIYYCDPDATITATVDERYSDKYGITVSSGSLVSGQAEFTGAVDFLQSSNRNAYPDNSVVDGYLYEYLGVPFDNATTAPKIAEGSYVGTGTYGNNNPNSITLPFEPKLIVLTAFVTTSGSHYLLAGSGENPGNHFVDAKLLTSTFVDGLGFGSGTSSTAQSAAKLDGLTFSWYNTNGASYQYNSASTTYHYMVIG